MNTDFNAALGTDTVALSSDELRETRGGNPWLVSFTVGIALALLDSADAFVEGVKEGYAWARAG